MWSLHGERVFVYKSCPLPLTELQMQRGQREEEHRFLPPLQQLRCCGARVKWSTEPVSLLPLPPLSHAPCKAREGFSADYRAHFQGKIPVLLPRRAAGLPPVPQGQHCHCVPLALAAQWDALGIFQSQAADSVQAPVCAFPAQQRAVAAAEAKLGSWSGATSVNYLCSVAWGCHGMRTFCVTPSCYRKTHPALERTS